jgi:inner membrane protein
VDNLTHTLVGLVAGEVIARSTADVPGGLAATARRSCLVTVAVIGSNLPDLDLVLTFGGFAPGKLGYLLHHRGHTHTIIGCLLLAALLYACVEVWARLRKAKLSRSDRIGIAGVALLAALLHLFMDWLNSYGVHPYWPFDNGWIYGDAVFIVEPLYWLSVAPLIFTLRSWPVRIVLSVALIAALGIGVFLNRGQLLWVAFMVLLAVVLLVLGKRCSARVASLASAAAMLSVTCVFVWSGRATARDIESMAAASFPGERTVDHVLTPIPTNPLCWSVLLIQTAGDRYIVRRGVVATVPSVLSAQRCPQLRLSQNITAPLQEVNVASSAGIRWLDAFSMSRSHLASIVNDSCEAFELMQFARAPFLAEEAHRRVLGDLRFDGEQGLGFAEIELSDPPPARCRFHVPWIPPRLALLKGPARSYIQ